MPDEQVENVRILEKHVGDCFYGTDLVVGNEVIVRDDGSGSDLGYPVATELDNGQIFTAYYFMEEDGNNFGGSRYMAASTFHLS